MKRAALLLIGVLALAGATSPAAAQRLAVAGVSITADGFKPEDVTIKPGDTVRWKNNDSEKHQVVADSGTFKSPVLAPGETYSFRFEQEASYSYHDAIKPSLTGTVNAVATNVTAAATRRHVVYGNAVRIFGSIPRNVTGETVTIHIRPYRGQETTKTAVTESGVYELSYRPRIRTEFVATWEGTTSQRAPEVNVRPRVTFSPLNLARNRFFVGVKPVAGYGSKIVRIQQLNNRGLWVTTAKVRLNRSAFRRFTGPFAHGTTKARAWVGSHPGYTIGFSATRTIRR